MVEHADVLYRGFEMWCDDWLRWPQDYKATMFWADKASNLLQPSSWSFADPIQFDRYVAHGGARWCCTPVLGATAVQYPHCDSGPNSPFPFSLPHRSMLPRWMPSPVVNGGYLEGNAVVDLDGSMALLLRCRVTNALGQLYTLEHACLFALQQPPAGSASNGSSADKKLVWRGFISMPGGGNKFTAR